MTLAHVGHWAVDLLYAAPLVLMAGVLVGARLRERRRPDDGPS